MSLIITSDLKTREVKNLGWLIRNWKKVEGFAVRTSGEFPNEAYMAAYCRDGSVYLTTWASDAIMKDWLHRPVFRGVRLDWYGQCITC